MAIAIETAHQKRGLGSRLINAALAWAAQEGIKRLELCVATENKGAIRLYARHGFVREGIKRKSFCSGDRFLDEYMMARVSKI